MAAVGWCNRGSTSSICPHAFLLWWLASITRESAFHLTPYFVNGPTNHLADFCSRSFHLQDSDFLCALISHPISHLGTLAPVPSDIQSKMISRLFQIIQRDVALGVSYQHAATTDNTWLNWEAFCASIEIDPTLHSINDPIVPLQLCAHRYHMGTLSPSKTKVRSQTVGDAIRAIGQTLANMGYADPRLLPSGKLTFCLS